MKRYLFLLGLFFTLVSCTDSSSNPNVPPKEDPKPKSIHIALGEPKDSDPINDYVVLRPQYVFSYDHFTNTTNWVAWNLNATWYGDVDRYDGNFISDTSLPKDWTIIKHSDYTNSGFDRGHMVRSEERTKTIEDNKSTFYMTNILPQTPDLNRGVWYDFELFCEDLCKNQKKELFVVAGGVYHSNTTINGKIKVPDSCFKIVVVLESGQSLKDVNKNTTVYAVMMPNIAGVRKDTWDKYKTTVDAIESSTGYDFLNAISTEIQATIESKKW